MHSFVSLISMVPYGTAQNNIVLWAGIITEELAPASAVECSLHFACHWQSRRACICLEKSGVLNPNAMVGRMGWEESLGLPSSKFLQLVLHPRNTVVT